MMQRTHLNSKVSRLSGMLVLASLVGSIIPGQAQQVQAEHSAQAIQSPVHLRLGATTVGNLAAEIGNQTSLKVEAEPALASHRLVVQLDGITAEAALQTLAELNGWTIVHPRSGYYRINPLPEKPPKNIAEMPAALRMALPMDFRRYLGLESVQALPLQASAPGQSYAEAHKHYLQEEEAKRHITARNKQLLDVVDGALPQALAPLLEDGRAHLYKELSPEQRENLLTLLIVEDLSRLNLDFLQGKLKGFQRDWTTAELTLRGGISLMIGTTTRMNGGMLHEGFGAPIQSLKPPADPKP